MTISGKGTLYKNQYGWRITDNQKNQDGTYTNYYIPVRFKKELEPVDKSFVSVKGYTSPYKNKEDKLGMSYYITEIEVIGSPKEEPKEENDPFANFNSIDQEDVELTDADLPF